VVQGEEQCDEGVRNGTPAACCNEQCGLKAVGTDCGGDTCLLAAICDGTRGTCPSLAEEDGAACENADDCTGGDSCRSGVCTNGVQCDGIEVPVLASPLAVSDVVPIGIALRDTSGSGKAKFRITGVPDFLAPIAAGRRRPASSRPVIRTTQGQLTARGNFSKRVNLQLTPAGKRLLAKLFGSGNTAPVRVQSEIRDRQGRTTVKRLIVRYQLPRV
jgi:hypothetical protein